MMTGSSCRKVRDGLDSPRHRTRTTIGPAFRRLNTGIRDREIVVKYPPQHWQGATESRDLHVMSTDRSNIAVSPNVINAALSWSRRSMTVPFRVAPRWGLSSVWGRRTQGSAPDLGCAQTRGYALGYRIPPRWGCVFGGRCAPCSMRLLFDVPRVRCVVRGFRERRACGIRATASDAIDAVATRA